MNARLCLLPPLLLATLAVGNSASAEPNATLAGRLFFSAAERRALEAPPPKPAASAPVPAPRRYDGALWRDGRLIAVWLDGQATKPANAPAIVLRNGVPTTTRGGAKPLFPGQDLPPSGTGAKP
ncbi:MAG: hypothetical protein LBR05_00030 [Azoarcus sp.]|jgi:hypothetical protein|nr:hypothetical protein [Azoarcus sp.]